ncbi:MAG: type II toxin-antitoxin system VapC family toxin [Terriglobales bacterium]
MGDRILPVDAAVADAAARVAAASRKHGLEMDKADVWIAATAVVHGLTLVTDNTREFRRVAVSVLDPYR